MIGSPAVSALDGASVLAVDHELASHPDFGDVGRIQRRAQARYEFALDILAGWLPGVAETAQVLRGAGPGSPPALAEAAGSSAEPASAASGGGGSAVASPPGEPPVAVVEPLRDPVVRMTLEAALWRLERGELGTPDELELVMRQAAAAVADGPGLLPVESGQPGGSLRAGPGNRIWLLTLREPRTPLQERLYRAMTDQFLVSNGLSGQLLPAGSQTARKVDQASDLLQSVLPGAGRVLDHVAVLGLIRARGREGQQLSAAGGDVAPGIVVVDPAELEDPWQATSTLLHEALHLHLFEVSRSYSLVADLASSVEIPWRPVRWDLRRALFAFHVYSHLVVFQAAAATAGPELTRRFGRPGAHPGVSRGVGGSYGSAAARARYLGEQLAGPYAARLTPDGRRLVDWLTRTLAPLTGWPVPAMTTTPPATDRAATGSPPPAGRYQRVPGLRLRPRPDLGCLHAFNPADRRLHYLNLNAWTVFELCDGHTSLEHAYPSMVAGKLAPDQAARHLRLAVTRLSDMGLIRPAGTPTMAHERR